MTGEAVLIAAQSGRALAAAARRAGYRPFVADLFGDEDTRALAEGYRRVAGRLGTGLGARGVEEALASLAAEAGASVGLVLGSGFEGAPGLMRRLAGHHRLLGASPEAVAALKDPAGFAVLCGRLGIPHPEIALAPVPDPEVWLAKRRGGSGGGHIRPAAAGRLPAGAYLQRRVPGLPRSLNALADGRTVAVLAVTEQWAAPGPDRPFRYAGAAGPAVLPVSVREAAERALAGLVAATGLRGLVSADLLVEGESWWLLEVNPRPGATLDVLDRGPAPLFAAHVAASLGRLPEHWAPAQGAAASEILYAGPAIPAVPPLDWPDWAMDRPPARSRVEAGAPICTVLAEGPDAGSARRAVAARAATLRAVLGGEPAAIASAFATSSSKEERGIPSPVWERGRGEGDTLPSKARTVVLAAGRSEPDFRTVAPSPLVPLPHGRGEPRLIRQSQVTKQTFAHSAQPPDPARGSHPMSSATTPQRPSVNALAAPLVEALAADAVRLRLGVTRAADGARLIDAGAGARGSVEAGRRIAEICLGGLGTVTVGPAGPLEAWPFTLTVHSTDPVLACLGSQYAGWNLADEEGDSGFFALGSGPGRAAAGTEHLFEELAYRDPAERIALVLESGSPPPASVTARVAAAAGVAPADVTFVYAPTQSLAGATQVVARVLEVALHKAHSVGFDLGAIVDGLGAAPLSPPHPDFIQAMGRTNDAIIYGGRVQLFVEADDADARGLAEALPSTTSRDHGAPFAEIFSRFNGDFYAIDKHLFSPAEVVVTSLRSGHSHRAGRLVPELVARSFA